MFRRMLVVYGVIIFFAATANVVEAQVVTRCYYPCGSDVVTMTSDKEVTVGDAVTVHSSSPLSTDIFTVCHSPQQRYVSGTPARLRTVKETVGSGDIFRQEKIKGQSIVKAKIPTHNTDINPDTQKPFTQAEFEAFWGIQGACNNPWTPIFVFTKRSDVTACISQSGKVVRTIEAECTYPYSDLQVKTDTSGAFIDFISVTAPCTIKKDTKEATGACSPSSP
jgi:hypothetical protein